MSALTSELPSMISVAAGPGGASELEKKMTAAFGAGFALLFLIVLWTSFNAFRSADTFRWMNHTHEFLEAIEAIKARLESADNAQRAYIITGAARDRDAREMVLADVRAQVRVLAALVKDDTNQGAKVLELQRRIDARVEIMRETEVLRENQGFEAARQLFLTRRPERAAADILAALRALESPQRALLSQRSEEVEGGANRVVSAFSILLALVFLALIAFAVGMRRHLKARIAGQQALAHAQTALEAHARDVEDLYNNAAAGYHSVEANGVFVRINDTELDWLGYRREELIGRVKLADLLTPESRKIEQQDFPLFKQGRGLPEIELEFVRKDGSSFSALLSGTVLRDDAGNFLMSRSTIFDITQRKRAQEKLREQLRFTQELVEALPHPLYLKDTAGRYLGFNRAWEEFFNTTRQQWVGKTAYDRFTKEVADRQRHNDDLLFQTRQPQSYEVTIPAGDAEEHDIIYKKSVFTREDGVVLGMIGVLTDISDLKIAQREIETLNVSLRERAAQLEIANRNLQCAREELQDYIDGMSTFSAKVAPDGTFLLVNKAGRQATGLSADQLMQTNFLDGQWFAFDPQVQQRVREAFARAVAGAPVSYHEKVLLNGIVLDISFSLVPEFDGDGAVAYLIAEGTDITPLKRAEHALREQAARLEVINHELESFSYSVSHDLRTPLRAVDGFARVLEEDYGGQLDAEGKRLLAIVRDSSQKMGRLIDALLTFARIGRKQLAATDIDMRAIVTEAFKELKQELDLPNVELRLGELPTGQGDSALLQQVWVNLLANALKFTRRRSNIVIEAGGYDVAEENVYYVSDNGAGFDMRYYDKLFGVFQRLHSADEFPGTGVGLAIVHRVVTRHGGRVWAEGRVDAGAKFFFTLPKGQHHGGL